jgi:hypothetical protein
MTKHHLTKTVVSDPARRFVPGKPKIQLFIIALLGAGLMFGCAQIRKVTYPEDYVYLEKKQVSSKMALLNYYMIKIDEILLEDSTINSDQQARIEDILVSMGDTVSSLETSGDARTSHLVIDDHIGQFRSDLNLALNNVRSDPPNYFALGKLRGSCAACHQYRKF